jgi:hypothetical protein
LPTAVAVNQECLAGIYLQTINIKIPPISQIHSDEENIGMQRIHRGDKRSHPFVWCKISNAPGINMDGVDMPVFVAVGVLSVDKVLVVVRPRVITDAALAFTRQLPPVLPAQSADPDLRHILLVRRNKREMLSVRRDLWIGSFGIVEEELARN